MPARSQWWSSQLTELQQHVTAAPCTTHDAALAADKYAVWDLADAPPKNIFEAAERGNLAYIQRILDRTVELDINARGMRVEHDAVWSKACLTFPDPTDSNCPMPNADNLQRTPLHWAAELGHTDIAKLLLDNGCDLGCTECNGRCAVLAFTLSACWVGRHWLLCSYHQGVQC